MKKATSLLALSLAFVGCHNNETREKENVISQQYIHKYGYHVSKSEWDSSHCPGQVVTTMKNGVTITSTYENGVLHGPTTYTYPHSNTRQTTEMYEHGELIKRVNYSLRGLPSDEELYFAPNHTKITKWFQTGTPLSVETYKEGLLVEGEYRNQLNETLSRITKGEGLRIVRNLNEEVIAKENYVDGVITHRDTFHDNGSPSCQIDLEQGVITGFKRLFAPTGEPLSVEAYEQGVLHGPATYYQNGNRYLEVTYLNGQKHGTERYYIDGEIIVQEIDWLEGVKHGPSVVYSDGMSRTQWYYNDEKVTREKFNTLTEQARTIALMNERSKN